MDISIDNFSDRIAKVATFLPIWYYVSRFYVWIMFCNAMFNLTRICGNLCCQWVTDPTQLSRHTLLYRGSKSPLDRMPLNEDAPTFKKIIYHLGVINCDVGACCANTSEVLCEIASKSIVFWFYNWQELDKELNYTIGTWTTIHFSMSFAGQKMLKALKEIASCRTAEAFFASLSEFTCGLSLVLLQLRSIYYVMDAFGMGCSTNETPNTKTQNL